jgi:hypothetical protein
MIYITICIVMYSFSPSERDREREREKLVGLKGGSDTVIGHAGYGLRGLSCCVGNGLRF